MKALLEKFYESQAFLPIIAICFALWIVYFIPLIVGIILLVGYQKHRQELEQTSKRLDLVIATKQADIGSKQQEIQRLEDELNSLSVDTVVRSYQYSDYDGISSEECKNKLSVLRAEEQSFIKGGSAAPHIYGLDARTKRERNTQTKQLIRCFNAESDNAFVNLSVKNIDAMRTKITKAYESLNKLFESDGVRLDKKLLESKLEQLNLVYTYELKKEQEREEQRAIREQMIEEEKARRELEQRRAKIEKDETQFKNEISKLMSYLQKTSSEVEKQLYLDKIRELEEKLKQLESDKKDILEREQNAKAGFVYIISNIGAFGEDVYKIGMTRRLEPMDRVKELGSASVPFPFDVHAMIFSADAPALEAALHQAFKGNQLNKINTRKEFYKVDLSEVEKLVKEKHNATVTFTMVADAAQYRQSIEQP